MDPITAVGLGATIANMIEVASCIINGFLEYCRSVKRAPAKSKEIREELLILSDTLKELYSFTGLINAKGPGVTALHKTLNECFELLKKMQAQTAIGKSDLIRRIKWPFNERENEEYLHQVERYKATIALAVSTLQMYNPPMKRIITSPPQFR